MTPTGKKKKVINTTPKCAFSLGSEEFHLIEHVALVPSRPFLDHPTEGARLKINE